MVPAIPMNVPTSPTMSTTKPTCGKLNVFRFQRGRSSRSRHSGTSTFAWEDCNCTAARLPRRTAPDVSISLVYTRPSTRSTVISMATLVRLFTRRACTAGRATVRPRRCRRDPSPAAPVPPSSASGRGPPATRLPAAAPGCRAFTDVGNVHHPGHAGVRARAEPDGDHVRRAVTPQRRQRRQVAIGDEGEHGGVGAVEGDRTRVSRAAGPRTRPPMRLNISGWDRRRYAVRA